MIRRTKLLASMRSAEPSIPAGLIELEYIKTSGSQWINTGITCDQDAVISVSVLNAYGCLVGNADGTNNRVLMARVTAPTFSVYFGGTSIYSFYLGVQNPEVPEIITLSRDGLDINDVHYNMAGVVGEFESDELYIFASPPYMESTVVTLYSVTIDTGGVCHKLVPVLDRHYEPCLYDMATGLCHYNGGTGDFEFAVK